MATVLRSIGAASVVVLGHEWCGAVCAAVAGGEAPGHLKTLVAAIAPAIEDARSRRGDLDTLAVRANTERVARELAASAPILSEYAGSGQIRVVGAYYDLDTGPVTVTYDPPGEPAPAGRAPDHHEHH